MECGITRASDMKQWSRMDAAFHIAVSRVMTAAVVLEESMTADKAKLLARSVPLHAKQPLAPLLKGQKKVDTASTDRAIDDYPFIALARIRENLPAAIEASRTKIRAAEMEIDALHQVKST